MNGNFPRDGAQLAADEFNAAGGINGKNIELFQLENASKPNLGLTS
ncbi:MAG: ABC transporter substrate-binding protein [Candidatus Korobacteraceae bacterium]